MFPEAIKDVDDGAAPVKNVLRGEKAQAVRRLLVGHAPVAGGLEAAFGGGVHRFSPETADPPLNASRRFGQALQLRRLNSQEAESNARLGLQCTLRWIRLGKRARTAFSASAIFGYPLTIISRTRCPRRGWRLKTAVNRSMYFDAPKPF